MRQYHSTAPALWPPGAGDRTRHGGGEEEQETLLHLFARPPQDVRSFLAQARQRRGRGDAGRGVLAVSPWFVAEVRAALGGAAWPSTGAIALAWARRHCARATAYGFGGGQPGGAWHYWERPEAPGHSRLADHGARRGRPARNRPAGRHESRPGIWPQSDARSPLLGRANEAAEWTAAPRSPCPSSPLSPSAVPRRTADVPMLTAARRTLHAAPRSG